MPSKIDKLWSRRGGYAGFGNHVAEVARQFPHIKVHPDIWHSVQPTTSTSAHLFVKAVELVEMDEKKGDLPAFLDRKSTQAAAAVRKAFFTEGRDISDWEVHSEIASEIDVDYEKVNRCICFSYAVAALAADVGAAQEDGVKGSPTFLMNNGRQKLFGDVGDRLIEANVQQLLRNPDLNAACWC